MSGGKLESFVETNPEAYFWGESQLIGSRIGSLLNAMALLAQRCPVYSPPVHEKQESDKQARFEAPDIGGLAQ